MRRKIDENNGFRKRGLADNYVHIFTQTFCPHCQDFKKFLEEIDVSKYKIKFYDMEDRKNLDLLLKYAKLHGLSLKKLGTPAIFSKNGHLVGFERKNGDNQRFLEFLDTLGSDGPGEDVKSDSESDDDPLSSKLTLLTALGNAFSANNLYVFLFLFLILFWCGFRRCLMLVCSYFCFYGVVDFMFLTGHLSIVLVAWPIRILLLLLGYLHIYLAMSRLFADSYDNLGPEKNIKDPIANPIAFGATLLTMLSSSVKFLNPTESWQKYELVLNKGGPNVYFDYAQILLLSVSYSLLNAMVVFLLWKIVKKYKNYFINHLTIINNILLFITGILILFA
ncbi:MAG: hypothetical protein LBI29_00970 [Rickettsiales bacterium]|jgi:glutaredoxin|nr:hypothetical protein [Rickettsiales bacterium]